MTLSVTNTLTGDREPFDVDDEEVLLYVCGLTVSDDAHLGHARVWVHADVIHRWLDHEGYDVRHVENVTDVNEKIAARVGEGDLGDDEAAVAEHFSASVLADMRGLNLERAEVYPRVSEHVPEIIDLVETLVEQGYAYESNGSVYFDVTEFEEYGKLSNQDLDELESQGDPDERSEKRNPADFALWKAGPVSTADLAEHRTPDLDPLDEPAGQTWESPWGEGRPGWHIECSAMSMTHLGETIDIHMGGRDLVFPHHENEIAQSEAATGHQFVRYWLHNGLLETKGEKMSSSLGNFFTVSDALEEYGVNVVRTFYLGAAYRSDQQLSEGTIAEAEERWERLERAYEAATAAVDSVDARTKVVDDDLRETVDVTEPAFREAMNDDFNVREATAALLELASAVNRHLEGLEAYDYRGLRRAVETFDDLAVGVFGLDLGGDGDGGDVRLADELVELVLDVREEARDSGEYERADALRDALADLGVEVEDSEDGPSFRY
ncbi:cysteine--tRNA ligase [Halobium salinum]|uniref:Cysteine--tRNA ligase n=1 Tax=Halobium salinum TaxID=1364940 RepID=A0ABD5P819_9EURY|nr:cysteine--tRNA ligase [Halobium salinum]